VQSGSDMSTSMGDGWMDDASVLEVRRSAPSFPAVVWFSWSSDVERPPPR
jgi:hypothetical protein